MNELIKVVGWPKYIYIKLEQHKEFLFFFLFALLVIGTILGV